MSESLAQWGDGRVDPITIATVSSAFLTQGVKFLYDHGGALLKRWLEKDEAAAATARQFEIDLPPVFGGGKADVTLDLAALAKLAEPLRALRKELSEMADGMQAKPTEVDLKNVDAFRQMIEAIYQRRLDFEGEAKRPDGPTVQGKVDVETVLGRVAAVRAEAARSGSIRGNVQADTVASSGEAVGVDIKGTIG